MNPNREIYGRMTINGERKSLGAAPNFMELTRRLATQYNKWPSNGKCTGILEFSYEPLPEETIVDKETQLAHEMQALMVTDPNEMLDIGITAGRLDEITDDADFHLYSRMCVAANRVGVPDSEISRIRQACADKFGEDHTKIRFWQDR